MTMRRIGLMQELPSTDKRRLKVERVERDVQRTPRAGWRGGNRTA